MPGCDLAHYMPDSVGMLWACNGPSRALLTFTCVGIWNLGYSHFFSDCYLVMAIKLDVGE